MNIYVLLDSTGKSLSPDVQATCLAKYSRSEKSAAETLLELTEEHSGQFTEKWVIQYGHSSVAELATLPICFEGVSMMASKFLEQYQRAAYSEKSTRYQKFDRNSLVVPPGQDPTDFRARTNHLFDAYENLYGPLLNHLAAKVGQDPSSPNAALRARVFDNLRYLLPAGTGTNLAMVANLRDIRYLIQDARGHQSEEVRQIGEAVFQEVSKLCPSFVKKAEPNTFEPKLVRRFPDLGKNRPPVVRLWPTDVHDDADFDNDIESLLGLNVEQFDALMNSRGPRAVPRIFRTLSIAFDILMDYGAYRDLQRHRRCEQFAEPLHYDYGYSVPDDILNTPLEAPYREAMDLSKCLNSIETFTNPYDQQYTVPMGYKHRSIFSMDLAELYYIVELRTAPQGHISYRRIAYEMFKCAKEVYRRPLNWVQAITPDTIGEHH